MSEHELADLIDELRIAIEGAASLSADERERLAGLVGRMEAAAEEEDDGLIDHIEESLTRFETEHSGIVDTINRIANALSAGGI